jgi:Flp pilus assembly pilin Flp
MRKINIKRAQSTLEYVVLVVVITAALLTIQIYFKRAVQGRIKSTSDDIGEQFSTTGNLYINEGAFQATQETTGVDGPGVSNSILQGASRSSKNEVFNLGQAQNEYWGK